MFHFEIELHPQASLRVQNIFMVAELGLTQASRHGGSRSLQGEVRVEPFWFSVGLGFRDP